MIKNKNFKKFYEVGNNRYYTLNFADALYLATECFLELPKKLFRKRELTQEVKLLEVTVPILMLFNNVVDMDILEKDEEFEDMTTYKPISNTSLRADIKLQYDMALEVELNVIREDFAKWCADFVDNNADKYTEEEINQTLRANADRLDIILEEVKRLHISNRIDTNIPKKKEQNNIVKKMLTNGLEFLYSIDLSSTLKVYYLYDLDKFGTLTIYKVTCVKEVVKSINSYIYNRTLLQELLAHMENNNL